MVETLRPMLRKAARLGKWIFIVVYYYSAFRALTTSFAPESVRLWGAGGIAVILLLATLALIKDRAREDQGKDDFRGNHLFYRYGGRVGHAVFPIPVQPQWSADETARFSSTLQEGLSRRIGQRLAGSSVLVSISQPITDLSSGEVKSFLRLLVRSRFGSLLTHFVHYAAFGQTITAHYFTFVRGTYGLLDRLEFVLLSPFTIWFWSLPWLLNCLSLIARISAFRDTSFDAIDIDTMHSLTRQVMAEETERLLADAGLLTDQIKQILHYNFNQINVSDVSGSAQVHLEGVAQAAGRFSVRQGR